MRLTLEELQSKVMKSFKALPLEERQRLIAELDKQLETVPPKSSAPYLRTPELPKGIVEKGNIDLGNRPRVKNPDGSISTVRSMSFNQDGKEVLVPTVSDDGRIMTNQEAIDQYHQTGKHLGIFDTPENATAYSKQLHEEQAQEYNPQ